MKTAYKVIGIIFSLLALYVFFIGLKECFTCEKAYIEKYGGFVFHSVDCCPELEGGKSVSYRECWNDISLDMCQYCFSRYDIEDRNNYLLKTLAKNAVDDFIKMRDEAREKRREKELEEFKDEHPEYFK